MSNNDANKNNSYLSFRLGEEIFALHVSKVHKILEVTNITEVPRSPDYMKGVINLRGNVLPVVDARVKFGMSPIEKTKSTSILVTEINVGGEDVMVGLMVDGVHSVLKLESEDLLPPPNIGNRYRSEFISNMARVKDKFFIVLNMDAVFSSEDQVSIKELSMVKEHVINENATVETDPASMK
ncbi:chemotaxis protein CheW [Natronoflexus pectinivorans]|uniref:Purine-binding chemotaxis protein CheW n=1 Tax=Natronoflexus pectinivorans TaxID=682526 RepID=A0A4V2RW53_9BACT|nr:chemotaxis protein CheW [Natronoflexus pectinivorans]TCO06824.1 purine-binding chemotaxis protein CheW [Natronoflexus pectinivorans]